MYFQFLVSGKIFPNNILIFITFRSIVPIKCHAVIPYWVTNIYSLMPVTLMVLLYLNTAATVCESLWLVGCSPDWSDDVVCDDARKPFSHVPPLGRVWYMIDNELCQDQLVSFCVYCNCTTREQAKIIDFIILIIIHLYSELEEKRFCSKR